MISIRKAKLEDLETLLGFEEGIIRAERPFDVTMINEPFHYYDIAEMIKADHIEVVVAENDGQLIGSGYARIEKAKHFLNHDQYAYLGFMFVHPGFRGKGVNMLIVEALKEWALSRNIHELRLDVYSENEPAVRAYEKAGFSPYLLNMRMGIKPNEWK